MNQTVHSATVPTSMPNPARIRVGDFTLDASANELIATDGHVSRIEPRLMALLVRLAQTPGAVVSRETLIDEVWSRRMVNDEVLSRAIADLRGALGDDSRTPRYIETIPKSGYRLIAAVTAEATPGMPQAVAATPAARRSALQSAGTVVGITVLMVAAVALIVTMRQSPSKRDTPRLQQAVELALREAKPLTASPGLEIGPRLSPDGKRVLYTLIEDGRAMLMLHDPALPAPRRVSEADEDVTSAVFMPDGVGVVYRSLSAGGCRLRQLTAGGIRDIAPCVRDEPSRIDLSPDGKWLVLSRSHRDSLPAGLAMLEMATGTVRQLTTPDSGDGEDTSPRFNTDGSQLAFVRGNSSAATIWIMPAAGGDARKVSPLTGLAYGLAWTPDGSALLVAADWFGFRALNWLDVHDGTGRLLGARGARAPDLASGRLVYENAIFQANLFRLPFGNAGTTLPEQIHASTRYTSQPTYSPDGGALAFVSNREGTEAIYVSIGGGEAHKLGLPDTHRYMRPAWSADGKSIYVIRMLATANKTAPQQAVRISLADGASTVLPLGDNASLVSESRDGRWLYVGEREERLMRVWRAPLDAARTAGKQERLPIPLVGEVQLNRDRMAFTQTGLSGITVCSQDGQTCEQKQIPVGDRHDDHWALSDGGIYFVEDAHAGSNVKRLDLKSGAITTVSNLAPTTLGSGLAVHPQETEITIAREQPPSIDLMTGTLTPLR